MSERYSTAAENILVWNLATELEGVCRDEAAAGLNPALIAAALALTVGGLELASGMTAGPFDDALASARETLKGKNRGN